MAENPVVNASPLIFLARGGYLDFLKLMGDNIVVPSAVAKEIQRRGSADLTVQAIAETSWLTVVQVPEIPDVLRAWDLGPGETSVLAWGYHHPGAEAIIDDLSARRCAKTLRLPCTGTLGLVLIAKKRGVISKARPVLEKLRLSGMYLSDHILDSALNLVGE